MDMVGLVEELKLHKTFDWLQKEVGTGEQARKLAADIMHSAAEDIENKIMCESKQLGMQVEVRTDMYCMCFCVVSVLYTCLISILKFIPTISMFITVRG